jgi:hypothetical protein
MGNRKNNKTTRTLATIKATDVATRLGVDRATVRAHIEKLNLPVHYGFGNQIMLTPTQAEAVSISIARNVNAAKISVDKDRAKKFVAALEAGATVIELITKHDATIEESDQILAWWRKTKNELVIGGDVRQKLEVKLGAITKDADILLGLEEAITQAASCHSCGTPLNRVFCPTCAPKPGRAPKIELPPGLGGPSLKALEGGVSSLGASPSNGRSTKEDPLSESFPDDAFEKEAEELQRKLTSEDA